MLKKFLILILFALVASCTSSGKNYSCLDDAAGDKIGVLMGSSQEEFITNKYPNAKMFRIDMSFNLVAALNAGSCDVAIFTTTEALNLLKVNPKLDILEDNIENKGFGVGFNKDSTKLRDEFNIFLAKIKANGLYDQIIERWTNGIDDAQMPEIVLPTTGNPLRIGTTSTSVPFSFDKNGNLSGIDIEIITRFAADLNCPVKFHKMNFGALVPALTSNKVDVIINSIMITTERANKIAFSDEYFKNTSTALVRKKDKASVQGYGSVNDVRDKRIAVLMGSTHDAYAVKNFPQAEITHCESYADVVMELVFEKCEAALFNTQSYDHMKKTHPQIDLLDSCLFASAAGIGFSYNQNNLKDEFNAFLKELRDSKALDEMVSRWSNDGEDATMEAINMPTTGKPIRVAVSGTSVPFSFIRNGNHAGLDIELLLRFGQSINRPMEFSTVNFGGLIAALSSGKVDVIASSLMITPERAKQVNFSDPYFYSKCVMAVLGKNLKNKVVATTGAGYSSSKDLRTKRIAVLTGSINNIFADENFPEAKIVHCNTYSDALTTLTYGKSDAAMLNKAYYLSIRNNNSEIVVLDSTLHSENSNMGFSYNQNDLKDKFKSFLKEIRESKLCDEIYDRWINDFQNAVMPDIEMPTSGEPIRVGVTGSSIPFSFVHNGKNAGLDIELMSRFAKSINRPVEFTVINFSGLISALEAGKVDVVTELAFTEERAKNINFSDSYYINSGVMLVLKKDMAGYNGETVQKHQKQGFFASVKDSFYNNIIAEKRYMLILKGLCQTLLISVFAAMLGTILGSLICFMRMSRNKLMNSIAKSYIIIMRGIPVLVLLMLLYYAVFAKWDINATIVAIITFALNFAAYVSEMFRTSIEGVDKGQNEAGIAIGFTKIQTFIFIIMPQAIKSVLPVYKGELISLIKMTSVVGYIAVEDLTKASDIIRSRTFDAFFPLVMVAIIYFLLAWIFATVLDRINTKMTSR